jgi:hypothetical protein
MPLVRSNLSWSWPRRASLQISVRGALVQLRNLPHVSHGVVDAAEKLPVEPHQGEFVDEGARRSAFVRVATDALVCTDLSSPTWIQHDKHFFVLSNSGKPIYTR